MSDYTVIRTFLRRGWPALLVLAALCACLYLPGLGGDTVARQQELRVVLTARDMAEGGDWLIPHFLGEERLRKPPLMYWIVAGLFRLTGDTGDIVAPRLAAAASATLLVLATFLLGRSLVGRRAAFGGAIVLATSLGFVRHARLAETDLPQAFFCSLAILALYHAFSRDRGNLLWWLAAGMAGGLGFMIKGPASLAMPLAALVVFGLVRLKKPAPLRTPPLRRLILGAVVAAVCFAAIALPWYIAVSLRTVTTEAQAGDEIARLLSTSSHKGPIVYYLYTLPVRMGLWGLLLPVAVWGVARRLRHHRGVQYLLGWFASSFAILSMLSSKQQHYAILLMTPGALLAGWLLQEGFRRAEPRRDFHARFARGYLLTVCGLFSLAAAAALAGRFLMLEPDEAAAVAGLTPAAVAILLLCGAALKLRRITATLPAVCLSFAIFTGTYAYAVEPLISREAAIPRSITPHRELIRKAQRFVILGPNPAIATWYAGRPVTVIKDEDPAGVFAKMERGDLLLGATTKKNPVDFSRMPVKPLADETQGDKRLLLFLK